MPLVENIRAGKEWISFTWQVSEEKCRKNVSGIWITLNPSLSGTNQVERFCSADPIENDQILFNTSLPCFGEFLYPCGDYKLKIIFDSSGNKFGQSTEFDTMTTPGSDATALVDSSQSGVDWMSFNWRSSVNECQKFISGYLLNVTSLLDDTIQFRNLSSNCSMKTPISQIYFNSSLPCAGNLEILPCSSYSLSITPEYIIENTKITGVSNSMEIGTKSGEIIDIVLLF